MLQHDQAKELRRRFLLTCVQRNRNHQLRLKALAEVAALRDAEAFDDAVEVVATWPRDERRAGAKVLLQALAERRIGRRDQAQAWVWRLAGITRELHEEYAVQRWPETKRLLGLFVNSSGRAHGRNARRIVHAARQQDRRLAISLLAAVGRAHAGGRGGAARGPDADGPQALRGRPRAAAQLPEVGWWKATAAPRQERVAPAEGWGQRRRNGAENGRRKGSRDGAAPKASDRTPEPRLKPRRTERPTPKTAQEPGASARNTAFMEARELIEGVRDALSVRQVFGEPVERDGGHGDPRRDRDRAAGEAAAKAVGSRTTPRSRRASPNPRAALGPVLAG